MNEENPYTSPAAELLNKAGLDASDDGIFLASRWRRFFGWFIDSIIAGLVGFAINWVIGIQSQEVEITEGMEAMEVIMAGMSQTYTLSNMLISFSVGLGVYLALNGYLMVTRGQTIAKMLLGIKVVDISGQPASAMQIIVLRYVIFQIVFILPVINIIAILVDALMIFGKQKRCLHDLVAKTKVIYAS